MVIANSQELLRFMIKSIFNIIREIKNIKNKAHFIILYNFNTKKTNKEISTKVTFTGGTGLRIDKFVRYFLVYIEFEEEASYA